MHQPRIVYGPGYNGIARMLELLGHSIGTEFMETSAQSAGAPPRKFNF